MPASDRSRPIPFRLTPADLNAIRRLQGRLQGAGDGTRVTMSEALMFAVSSATALLDGETAPAGPEPAPGTSVRLHGPERKKVEAE